MQRLSGLRIIRYVPVEVEGEGKKEQGREKLEVGAESVRSANCEFPVGGEFIETRWLSSRGVTKRRCENGESVSPVLDFWPVSDFRPKRAKRDTSSTQLGPSL